MKYLIIILLLSSQILSQTWLEKSESDLQELTELKEQAQRREYFTKAKIGFFASTIVFIKGRKVLLK